MGVRIIANCNEEYLKFYVPQKRSGHSMITLGDQSGIILYGGYSTICADYCNDMWHLNTNTFIWTFVNMSDAPRPRYVSAEEYVERYAFGAVPEPALAYPSPSRRWQHSMAAINGTCVALFGMCNGRPE